MADYNNYLSSLSDLGSASKSGYAAYLGNLPTQPFNTPFSQSQPQATQPSLISPVQPTTPPPTPSYTQSVPSPIPSYTNNTQQYQLPQQPIYQQSGLTLADLDNWWKQQQAAMNNGVGVSSPSTGLSNLYPRAHWGNYQTSSRGGRYFDPTTGQYRGLGNTATTSL